MLLLVLLLMLLLLLLALAPWAFIKLPGLSISCILTILGGSMCK